MSEMHLCVICTRLYHMISSRTTLSPLSCTLFDSDMVTFNFIYFKIELGEDEEVQIQFDDIESVQHLFETGQLTVANDEQAIILEGNLNVSFHCIVGFLSKCDKRI